MAHDPFEAEWKLPGKTARERVTAIWRHFAPTSGKYLALCEAVERAIEADREWQPIATAPRDFTPILAAARGVDGRWMRMIVSWAQVSTMFRSDRRMDLSAPDCEWVGEMGTRYGVSITHWMPLPRPPGSEGA